MIGRFVSSAATMAIGYALAAGLWWALLNVPESNVLALTASALCVVLIAVTVGLATGGAAAAARGGSPASVLRRAGSGLPGFFTGLAVFAALWWATGRVDGWWSAHRGEIDAVFLRYLGATGTAPLHTTIAWVIWFVRWVVGLSFIVGPTVMGTERGLGGLGAGLRLSLRFVPIVAAAAGVLVVSKGLWRLVYWRPASLPATSAEVTFAVAKLGVLYLMAIAVATLVVRVYSNRAVATT